MWRARRATPAPVALVVGNNTERALNARLYSSLCDSLSQNACARFRARATLRRCVSNQGSNKRFEDFSFCVASFFSPSRERATACRGCPPGRDTLSYGFVNDSLLTSYKTMFFCPLYRCCFLCRVSFPVGAVCDCTRRTLKPRLMVRKDTISNLS